MADSKSHKAIKQHIDNARGSLDKIEEILSALKGQQQPETPAQSAAGVSPLGGQAQ